MRAKGEAPAWPPPRLDDSPGGSCRAFGWKPLALVLVSILVVVGAQFWFQVQPPRVSVRPDGLEIESPFYGKVFPASDVTGISLLPTLPRVLARTNGFAGAGSLRGHFRVEGLGDGRLSVEEGFAPYVLVRLREGFVVVNFGEPEKTRALFDELARTWPERVATGAP